MIEYVCVYIKHCEISLCICIIHTLKIWGTDATYNINFDLELKKTEANQL